MLFDAVARHHPHGERVATAADLPELLQHLPDLSMQEDFTPYDPREEVLIRWGGELFRVLGSSLERPSASLNQQALLASAIDPVLVPRLGFGLGDIGELVLRRIDDVVRVLAPHWPAGLASDADDAAWITQAEVDAANTLPAFGELPDRCAHPDRATAAANRYTVNNRDLAHPSAYTSATFGATIATRHRGHVRPLPAAYLVEALPAIGLDLASQAAAASSAAETAFSNTVRTRVARRFKGSGQLITGPLRVGSRSPLHSLVIHNDRQVIALNVVAELTAENFSAKLHAGDQALQQVVAGVSFATPAGSHALSADAQVVRANIIAWPHPVLPGGTRFPVLTLDDLEWILYTAKQSPEDLWYFLRDLSSPAGVETTFAWDMIDRWEVWRQTKTFYHGGKTISFLTFAAHHAAAEWQEASTNAPIERALLALGLPPLRDWPIVNPEHPTGTEIADVSVDEVWQVLPLRVPAAVAKTDPSAPRERRPELFRFAVGMAWKLNRCADAFEAAASRSGLTSLRIVFAFQERQDGPPLTVAGIEDGVITIAWDAQLQPALAEDSFAVERLAGEVLAEALTEDARAGFIQAWQTAPPGIRVDGFRLSQRVQRLPDPIQGHASIKTDVLRRLGEFLIEDGAEPGLLEGVDATRFESKTVFPWLIARLHEAIASLSPTGLLEFALGQLERVHHKRFMIDKQLGWQMGFPTGGDLDRSREINRVTEHIRVVSLIVEEVLGHPPAGTEPTDMVRWIHVVSIAELCLDSCVRSAAIHNQLTHTAAKITESYEVETLTSHEPTDIDIARYQRLRSRHSLPEAVPITTGLAEPPQSDGTPPAPIAERVPRLKPIDEVLHSALGFGLDAVLGVFEVATHWEASEAQPATATTSATVVDECVRLIPLAGRDEFAAALEWLTLCGNDLSSDVIPHWETERRANRISTSPFVKAGSTLWVLPWTTESARKIFLNYLRDGRLPRPHAVLPETVNTVLNKYRQEQNREAEKKCTAALSVPGLIVRSGVKPEKKNHYGLAQLSGEIDTLCVDPARSRIWVIEVKDSYTPYSSHQVRQLVDRFNKPGKYVDRLLAKVADVEVSAASVTAALRVSDPERAWTVLGLMVTRHVEPAAFTVSQRIPYCLLSDVLAVVDQDELPGPGLHGPSTKLTTEPSSGED
ncbi:hypothetical protein [Amycolatopsis sp. CA-128772]|uniref:hypothetical protein n=1 Tax=Amycolatopsis sp. CA-128772 TaxID=2073159 RepID=UPI000CD1BE9A|nr:hypothetical protein [Amycolatopsis sp. CA-128772]